MKKRFGWIRAVAILLLVVLMTLTFASCGSSGGNAESASGTHGALSWNYDKDTKTLTLTGSGAMADFGDADAVLWAQVRTSAEKLVLGEGITTIGNYAFYAMSALKEMSLPSTLTVIGTQSFAFCGALNTVSLPLGVTTIGESAFEGCGALTAVYLPASVTVVGDRSFAFCYSMSNFMMTGEPSSIGHWTFKNCRSLDKLVFRTSMTADRIAEDAFEGARKSFADATLTDNETGATRVLIRYVVNGEVVETKSETYEYGTDYSIPTPTREGYTADQLTVTGTANGAARDVTVTYTSDAVKEEETETVTEEAPEEDEPVSAMTIFSIVIMAVVLIGIAVGAFLLLRSDKKDSKKGSTVKKKTQAPTGKSGKSGKKSGK
ncbi:MAG: leucine-rich repeat protein [Clostridia bacterium]|nr:leucine-rich repeat protein [Clostridia bacterium]